MRNIIIVIGLVLPMAGAVASVNAATFDTGYLVEGSDDQWISIDGQIAQGDFQAFEEKAGKLTAKKVAVILSGPGGNLIAAMRIGAFIRLKGWATVVATECSSACAAIWLAGHPRMMNHNARIGFHAASVDGQAIGSGNAVYGAYMTRLGLDYEAIDWVTTASPRDISYLSPAKAKELGIDVSVIDPEPEPKQAAIAPTSPLEERERAWNSAFKEALAHGQKPKHNCNMANGKCADFMAYSTNGITMTVSQLPSGIRVSCGNRSTEYWRVCESVQTGNVWVECYSGGNWAAKLCNTQAAASPSPPTPKRAQTQAKAKTQAHRPKFAALERCTGKELEERKKTAPAQWGATPLCCPTDYAWDRQNQQCRLASSFRPDPVP